MEEQNRPHISPIAGEPASLKPGMVVPRGALMGIRATLQGGLCDFNDTDGLPVEQLPWEMMAHDLAAAVRSAYTQVTALLGITEPADEDDGDTMFKRPLVESDFTVTGNSEGDEEMPADYWHGEMRAEAEAERRADAALELAAELASCDWEGWD